MSICCAPFEPIGPNDSQDSVHATHRCILSFEEDTLRDAARRLRNGELHALEDVRKIFSQHTPFCPVTLSLRRCCLLFISGLCLLGRDDSLVCSSLGQLAVNIVRLDLARTGDLLINYFLRELVDVARILLELRNVEDSVEVFQGFVGLVRVRLGGSEVNSAKRGVAVSGGEYAKNSLINLVALLAFVLRRVPHYGKLLLSPTEEEGTAIVQKIGLVVCALASGIDRPSALLLLEVARALGEDVQDQLREMVRGMSDGLAGALSDGFTSAVEVDQSPRPVVTVSGLMDFARKNLVHAKSAGTQNFFPKNCTHEQLLEWLVHDKPSVPQFHSPLELLDAVTRDGKQSVGGSESSHVLSGPIKSLLEYIVPKKDLLSVLSSSASPISPQSIVHQFIAQEPFESSTVALENLDLCILVILLSEGQKKFLLINFLVQQYFPTYSFPQLVEASVGDLVVRLVGWWCDEGDAVKDGTDGFDKKSENFLNILRSLFAQCDSLLKELPESEVPPVSKKQRTILHAPSVLSLTQNILFENFLHLVEQTKSLFGVALLVQLVDARTVQTYAVRTAETLWKYFLSGENDSPNSAGVFAWHTFYIAIRTSVSNQPAESLVAGYLGCVVVGVGDNEGVKRGILEEQKKNWKHSPAVEGFFAGGGESLNFSEVVPLMLEYVCAELSSAERITPHKLGIVKLLVDRIEEIGLGEFLNSLTKPSIASLGPSLVRLIETCGASDLAGSAELSICVSLLSRVGMALEFDKLAEGPLSRSSSQHNLSSLEGLNDWCASLIVSALIPRIKLNSHAYAVQEILGAMGGGAFLAKEKSFSAENKLVLAPFLKSSYRVQVEDVGERDNSDAGSPLGLGLILMNCIGRSEGGGVSSDSSVRSKLSKVFQAIRVAASSDEFVAGTCLAGLIELALVFASEDVTGVVKQGFVRMLSENRCYARVVFETMDKLTLARSRYKGGKEATALKLIVNDFVVDRVDVINESSTSLPLHVLVRAAVEVEDFARALMLQERVVTYYPKDQVPAEEVLLLCEIYQGLGSGSGVTGTVRALTGRGDLGIHKDSSINGNLKEIDNSAKNDAISRLNLKVLEERDFDMYLHRLESGESADGGAMPSWWSALRTDALIRAGLYRSCGDGDDEAVWKGGGGRVVTGGETEGRKNLKKNDISHEEINVVPKNEDPKSVFHKLMAEYVTSGCMPAPSTIRSLQLSLAREFSQHPARLRNLAFLAVLDDLESRGSSSCQRANTAVHSVCREIYLEAVAVIGCGGLEKVSFFRHLLLRHYRKSGQEYFLRHRLHWGVDASHNVAQVTEWAKCCWSLGRRGLAREALTQVVESGGKKSSSVEKMQASLLLLRWSTELEVLIPRLVIAKYRELLLEVRDLDSANGMTNPLKEGIHFYFGEYLDSSIDASTSDVWNKQLLVREIAFNFFESIKLDASGKRLLYTINRLLQLHWELSHGESQQMIYSTEIVRVLAAGWNAVPKWVWYLVLPGLVSRVGVPVSSDPNASPEMSGLCEKIICSVFAEYPRQTGWIVSQLMNSKIAEKKSIGNRLFHKVIEVSEYPNIQQLVTVLKTVTESLVNVARLDLTTTIKSLAESKEGSRLLRDTGGLLVLPVKEQISAACAILGDKDDRSKVFFGNEIRIAKFSDQLYIYNTKAKPKRISAVDSNGRSHSFILKLEKKTDLRKDSRVMEFVNVVNYEFSKNKSKVTNAELRTYSVLILSEDTALIEFVPNLLTMRKVIENGLSKIGKNVNMYLNKEIMNKLGNKIEGFAYYQQMVEQIPPMISDWQGAQFGHSPNLWLANRTKFAATQALWSMVGYVIGLGDRHPDNQLIDEGTGEIVHVDFDCIFSRGMVLNIPELVPFRLTPICVSAMGPTHVEGLYRKTCESVLQIMRNRKKTLLAILHAFIADPIVDWQSTTSSQGGGGAAIRKAKDVVQAIEKKLNGFVDVGEHRVLPTDEKLIVYMESSDNAKMNGLGKDRGAPLSVEGQVDELIRAAICQRNLSKMYLGWMPMF